MSTSLGSSIDGPSVSVASGDVFDVRQYSVTERMSSLFVVNLVAHCTNPSVDFDGVVGKTAKFNVRAGAHDRTWTGLCSHLQQVAVEENGTSTYHLTLVPMLWLTTQRRNHRMFQQLSELEIVLQILGEWGITPDKKLGATYKKRKYKVQYAETDYAFISRMLEDVGISFYFELQGDETKLVLCDAPQSNTPRPLPVSFRDNPTSADLEHVTHLTVGQQVRSGKMAIRDHDYRLPADYKLLMTAEGGGDVEQQLEEHHYTPGAFLFRSDKGESTPVADDRGKTRTDETEGQHVAQMRLDALRGAARVFTFQTNALDLAPGVVMRVVDHPHVELGPGKKLLIVESTLNGSPGEITHWCEARSADKPYRPEMVTPRPKVSGVESATVTGPKGEEIHTDEFGRVRVHFHWDRESKMDEKSSCWIHVSQAWAGAGFGTTHLPRIGQEVLVDFLGGDPDRPIIVGRVYTNLEKTPYKLPDHKTQTGWKSNSTNHTGGYNEIMFEDLSGKELVRMQAEKDLTKLVKHNESVTIGNDRGKSVGHDDSLTVGHDRTRMVGNDEKVTIGNDQSITVGANQTITVGENQTETIMGDRSLTLVGNLTETIVGHSDLTQTAYQNVTLTGNRSETIAGDMSLMQAGSQTELQAGSRTLIQLGGSTVVRLGNEGHFQLGNETQVRAGTSTHLYVGPQTETVTTVKTLNSPTVNVNADLAATIKSVLIELIATGQVHLHGPTVNIDGGTINAVADGQHTVKGSVVKLNC